MEEFIVKYNGVLDLPGFTVEILNENYAIVTGERTAVEQLFYHPQIEYVEPAKKLFPVLTASMNLSCVTPVKRTSGLGLTGQGVAVGIIDSGIDTAHPEFLDADGSSRILYFWDMAGTGTPPEGFPFGAEYTMQQISDGLLQSGDIVGHGTAVACIAAGNSGVASGSAIIAVKLNTRLVRSTDVMRGVKYIIEKARVLQMPCAINLSYGTNDGSHTGDSLFETYLSDMARKWKTSLVCAAGNEGYGGHHFAQRLLPNETLEVAFATATVRSDFYLTLWKNFSDTVSYELISPNGRHSGRLTALMATLQTVLDGVRINAIYGQPNHYTALQEVYFYFQALEGSIPNGIWTLVCYGEDIVDGTFQVWLPTIGEVSERTAFLQPTPDLTMTLPSTSEHVIGVGGYRGSTETISAFSGRDGPACGSRVRLDLVAPDENIVAAKTGGGYDAFTGTSMAAPFVTGSAALMMQWGIVQGHDPFLYGERIKAFLCRNAKRKPYLTYPNPTWGYGILQLCDAMDELIELSRR